MLYKGEQITDLKVVRTGQETFNVEFTVPDDGTGQAAQVQVRSAPHSAGSWWWGKNDPETGVAKTLLTTNPGEFTPGQYVQWPVDAGMDLDGVATQFQAVPFRFDEAEGENVFGNIFPRTPGLLVEFGKWVEPEPELEPEPVVQQQFSVATPKDGDTGVTVLFEWVGPLESVTFFVDGDTFDAPAEAPGTQSEWFLELGRVLEEGSVLFVDSVGNYEGRTSAPFPSTPYEIVVAAAETEPTSPEEPTEEPTGNGSQFPMTTEARFEDNPDEFYLDFPNGETRKMSRIWKWLDFGWFGTWSIYIGRTEE